MSRSFQTSFLHKRKIFLFFAVKFGHFIVHTFFHMLQTLKLNSKNRKTKKIKFGRIDSRCGNKRFWRTSMALEISLISDNNNRMIQCTDVYCWSTVGPAIYDSNKRLILLFGIQLSGGHCNTYTLHLEKVRPKCWNRMWQQASDFEGHRWHLRCRWRFHFITFHCTCRSRDHLLAVSTYFSIVFHESHVPEGVDHKWRHIIFYNFWPLPPAF